MGNHFKLYLMSVVGFSMTSNTSVKLNVVEIQDIQVYEQNGVFEKQDYLWLVFVGVKQTCNLTRTWDKGFVFGLC